MHFFLPPKKNATSSMIHLNDVINQIKNTIDLTLNSKEIPEIPLPIRI